MSIDPPPQPTAAPSPTQRPAHPFLLLLASVGGILIVLCIFAIARLNGFGAGTSPAISAVTTARGVNNGMLVDETRVFDIGEAVHIAYTISSGRKGYTLAVHITQAGTSVQTQALARALSEGEQGLESLVFVPKAAGIYQSTLLLNGTPIANAQVTFKVVAGGSPLQDVTTTSKVDQRTYKPLDQTTVFQKHDTISITYRVINIQPGDQLMVVYYRDGQRQQGDARDHDTYTEAGTFRGFFSISGATTALAAGAYRAELFYNNDLVVVRTFEVK